MSGAKIERRDAPPARGVLRTGASSGANEHRRRLPDPVLAPFVAHFWSVRWSLEAPFETETLPHPSVHFVVEWRAGGQPRAEITGVHTRRFSRVLEGEGEVFGIKFRPAAFQPFFGASMTRLANRVVDAETVFGADARTLASAIAAPCDLEAKIRHAEAFLLARLPALDAEVARLRDVVERTADDRTFVRVEDLAAELAVDVRGLQRRFARYVGAPPKWVLHRHRMHEAAERLKAPDPPSLAALASELGYFDQAHFTRDFRAVVGRTPGRFLATEGHEARSSESVRTRQ